MNLMNWPIAISVAENLQFHDGARVYDRTLNKSMKYYNTGADGPFNFNLVYINKTTGGKQIHETVDKWLSHMPSGKWPTWTVSKQTTPWCSRVC